MYRNECHLFMNSDASWIYKTRQNLVTRLNPIQFELLLERCQFMSPSSPSPPAAPGGSGVGGSSNEPDLDLTNFITPPGDNFQPGTLGMNDTVRTGGGNATEGTPIVYPGTKWCGRGATARSYDDIGIYAHTDRCCRDHDNCNDNILAGETKHGLRNEASFTSSHCDCDDAFLSCLRSDATLSKLTSAKIAHIYFNILKPLCFAERHPVVSCRKTRLTGECIRPDYNFKEGRRWQFFQAQPYFAKTVRGLLDTFSNIFGPEEATVSDPTSHSGRRHTAMPPGFTF